MPFSYHKNPLYKKIFSNSFYLSINYALNFLIPVIITPFCVKKIGLDKYGIISIALYIAQYSNLIVDYGFNLIATREISINEKDPAQLSEITSTALMVKVFLTIITCCVLLLLFLFIPYFKVDFWVYTLSLSIIIGQGLSTNWFFQGIQQIKKVSLLSIFFRAMSVISIFVLIKQKDDYIWINFLLGIGNVFSSFAMLIIIFNFYPISFIFPTRISIVNALKKGWDIFTSNLYIGLYNYSTIIILSLFAPAEMIGIYSVLEKITYAFRQIIGVFIQAVYPTTCKLATKGYRALVVFLKPIWLLTFSGFTLIFISVFIYSKEIITFTIGFENEMANYYLRVLMIIPIIVLIATYFLIIVLSFGQNKSYSRVFLIASLISIMSNFYLARIYLINGTIISIFITEVFVLASMFFISQKNISKHNKN